MVIKCLVSCVCAYMLGVPTPARVRERVDVDCYGLGGEHSCTVGMCSVCVCLLPDPDAKGLLWDAIASRPKKDAKKVLQDAIEMHALLLRAQEDAPEPLSKNKYTPEPDDIAKVTYMATAVADGTAGFLEQPTLDPDLEAALAWAAERTPAQIIAEREATWKAVSSYAKELEYTLHSWYARVCLSCWPWPCNIDTLCAGAQEWLTVMSQASRLVCMGRCCSLWQRGFTTTIPRWWNSFGAAHL